MSSRLTIAPFGRAHLDAAAMLLAEQRRNYREQQPFIPEAMTAFEQAHLALERELNGDSSEGAVALRSGEVVGYLIAKRVLLGPTDFDSAILRPRAIVCNRAGWAAAEPDAYDVIRALYAELAADWVSDGFFAHYVMASTASEAGLRAWHSLGFGHDMNLCHRGLTELPSAVAPSGVEVRPARSDDTDDVMALVISLEHHHSASPMFFPYLREVVDVGWRNALVDMMAAPDSEVRTYLATRNGQTVGLVQLVPAYLDMRELLLDEQSAYLVFGVTAASERGSGIGRALVTMALAAAAQQGITDCLLHVHSANISGSRFWHAYGFVPVEYRMVRSIDERIAWAHS